LGLTMKPSPFCFVTPRPLLFTRLRIKANEANHEPTPFFLLYSPPLLLNWINLKAIGTNHEPTPLYFFVFPTPFTVQCYRQIPHIQLFLEKGVFLPFSKNNFSKPKARASETNHF